MFMHLRLVLILALAVPAALAQSGRATITGNVTDQSGAAIQGAKIAVRDPATGFLRETVTNESGLYSIPGLRPATYDIAAESTGFRRHSQTGFTVEVDQIARLDIQLQVGDVLQEVKVTSAAQLLHTESATVGALIDQRKILDLPLNGRNFVQLALLVPGVNTGQPGADRGGSVSIGGTRSEQNAFQLDGVSNSDQWDNNLVFRPNIDSIQEFKIQVNNYSAEFGKGAGGQINVVTRGGTNDYHGSLYEFNRNDAVQARNLFQRDPNFRNSEGKFIAPPFNQNQFGGTMGGRIVRDRTFFFVDYEGFRLVRGQTGLRSVPDEALRRGDFAAILGGSLGTDGLGRPVRANQLYDPLTSRLFTNPATNRTTYLRDPFPGNLVPAARWDPVARNFLQTELYPLPNVPGSRDPRTGNPRQNYTDSRSRRNSSDQFATRIDQRLSDKDYVYGRYSFIEYDGFDPGPFPGQERFNNGRTQLVSLSHTRTMTPTVVNELRFGYQRSSPQSASKAFLDGTHYVNMLGIPGIPTAPPGIPEFTIAGFTSVSGGTDAVRTNNTYQFIEQISFNKGRNFFKTGFEYRRIALDSTNNITRIRGTFNIDNTEWTGLEGFPGTGNAFANFLLGLSQRKGRSLAERTSRIFASELSGYIQDDFKATSKLTLNLGMRYQLYIPPKEASDRVSSVRLLRPPGSYHEGGIYVCKDPARCAALDRNLPTTGLGLTLNDVHVDRLPEIVVAGKGVPRSLVVTEKLNFGPRIGIAYQVSPATVIRTGYGLFFDTVPISYFEDSIENIPWTREDLQTLSPYQFGLPPAEGILGFINPNPKLTEITPGPNSYDVDFRNAYVQQWNFTVQRQLGNDLVVEAGYAGSKGTRLNRREGRLPAEPRSANAVLPATLHPQMRLLVPFMVFDNQLITVSDWYSTTASAFSNYHALVGRFEKRFGGGLSFINSFTWSKAISDAQPFSGGSNDTGNRIQDVFNKKADKGLAPYDHKLRFVSSFLYELPFGRGKRFGAGASGVLNGFIGDWQLNGILSLQSGYPITVRRSGDPLSIGTDGAVRPDMVCNPNLPRGQRTVDRFFDTACFVAPPDRFGNAGRSTVIGPGINSWDLAMFKAFRIRESVSLQFRAEFFNAFNHPDWGIPGRDVGAGGLGLINSASDPRIIQFGLKLLF